ncbi:MAG: hypothetical protein ACAH20_15740 [Methylobacteriaceae bacterium]
MAEQIKPVAGIETGKSHRDLAVCVPSGVPSELHGTQPSLPSARA